MTIDLVGTEPVVSGIDPVRQLVQSIRSGELSLVEVPLPVPGPTEVLVATTRSVVSPGTERAVTQLASSSLIQKAKARPDLVRQVIAKARSEGGSGPRPEPSGASWMTRCRSGTRGSGLRSRSAPTSGGFGPACGWRPGAPATATTSWCRGCWPCRSGPRRHH